MGVCVCVHLCVCVSVNVYVCMCARVCAQYQQMYLPSPELPLALPSDSPHSAGGTDGTQTRIFTLCSLSNVTLGDQARFSVLVWGSKALPTEQRTGSRLGRQ